MKKAHLIPAALILVHAAAIAAFAQDTVTLPAKPKNPRAGRTLALREAFRISDAAGGFYFKSPAKVLPAPDGGAFVVDEEEFLRFDGAGRFVVNMFRKGQGPGEFAQIESAVVRGTELLAFQESPMKCVRMGLDGRYVSEVRPEASVSNLYGLYGDRLLMAGHVFPDFGKIVNPKGDYLDIVWTLKLMTPEGGVRPTSLTYNTKWFAMRLPGAVAADNVTFLHCVPLGDSLAAVVHEDVYAVKIVDPGKDAAVRTIRRDYRRAKYEPQKISEDSGARRRLEAPRAYFNDIQRIFAVDGRLWIVTSTLVPGQGVAIDVISPLGEYLDSFFLPLPKDVDLHALPRHPLWISGRTLLIVETLEDGRIEVVKYEIVDPGA